MILFSFVALASKSEREQGHLCSSARDRSFAVPVMTGLIWSLLYKYRKILLRRLRNEIRLLPLYELALAGDIALSGNNSSYGIG